jgi:hypothetical protein
LEGSGHGLIEVLFRNLPGGTEENHENLRIAGVSDYIPTEHSLNVNLELYPETSPFGLRCIIT